MGEDTQVRAEPQGQAQEPSRTCPITQATFKSLELLEPLPGSGPQERMEVESWGFAFRPPLRDPSTLLISLERFFRTGKGVRDMPCSPLWPRGRPPKHA